MLQVPQEHFRLSRLPWTRTERWRYAWGWEPVSHKGFAGSTGVEKNHDSILGGSAILIKGASPKKVFGRCFSFLGQGATVDGRNPAPVEVGSFSHYL